MKSIAAVALSEGLTQVQVTAAGVTVGAAMILIGISDLIQVVNWMVPLDVVSGIQIGVGLKLAITGVTMIGELEWLAKGGDCIVTAVILSVITLYWLREKPQMKRWEEEDEEERASRQEQQTLEKNNGSFYRFCNPLLHSFSPNKNHPVGIYLFIIGAIFAAVSLINPDTPKSKFRFFGEPVATWALDGITPTDWKIGFLEGTIPQLPLTTLNSVISVCALASSLYPDKRCCSAGNENDAVLSRREVSVSVGVMNLAMCPFGAMPNCHGAGGLAGQHRFGARHGACVVFLGLIKIVLAVLFGQSVLTLLDAIPLSVLGILLVIAGQELATMGYLMMVMYSSDQGGKCDKFQLRRYSVVATITALVTLGLGETHLGVLAGWFAHMIYGDGCVDLYNYVKGKFFGKNAHQRDDAVENSIHNTEYCSH